MWLRFWTDSLSSRFAAPRFFSHSRQLLTLPQDPILRRLALDKYVTRKRFRYANDPEYREREKANNLRRYLNYDDDTKQAINRCKVQQRKRNQVPLTRLNRSIDKWVRGVIDRPIQWSTHKPIIHPEKIGLRCEDCTRESFRKATLWVCSRRWRLFS